MILYQKLLARESFLPLHHAKINGRRKISNMLKEKQHNLRINMQCHHSLVRLG